MVFVPKKKKRVKHLDALSRQVCHKTFHVLDQVGLLNAPNNDLFLAQRSEQILFFLAPYTQALMHVERTNAGTELKGGEEEVGQDYRARYTE